MYAIERPKRPSLWPHLVRMHWREILMAAAACFAVGAVFINALFLQNGPHPAPIFANQPATTTPADTHTMKVPRPRPAELKVEPKAEQKTEQKVDLLMPARTRIEVVAEIQRELALRGFYNGPSDGVYGPKTDMAIRDFEHTASLRPSTEPNETLRRAIARSQVKATPSELMPDRNGGKNQPSKRVVALQRVLSDYGYGQLRPTGLYDPPTRTAIEEFERNRKLPVTGQISDRLTRELTAMTRRPLE